MLKALLKWKYISCVEFIYIKKKSLFPSSTKLVHSIVESNLVGQTRFAVSDISSCSSCAWKLIPRGGLHDLSTNWVKADGIILAFSRRDMLAFLQLSKTYPSFYSFSDIVGSRLVYIWTSSFSTLEWIQGVSMDLNTSSFSE